MKEIKDIHLKTDAVLHLFDQIISTVPHEHFKEFKDEIIEKSKSDVDFLDLNEILSSSLVDACIEFIYGSVSSKNRIENIKETIFNYVEDELSDMDTTSERALNVQRLIMKHFNAMNNYAEMVIDDMANNININIK